MSVSTDSWGSVLTGPFITILSCPRKFFLIALTALFNFAGTYYPTISLSSIFSFFFYLFIKLWNIYWTPIICQTLTSANGLHSYLAKKMGSISGVSLQVLVMSPMYCPAFPLTLPFPASLCRKGFPPSFYLSITDASTQSCFHPSIHAWFCTPLTPALLVPSVFLSTASMQLAWKRPQSL